jgi:hypothetical protein
VPVAALEGDLRSFSVVDVVTMLAATHKTGRLSVVGAWDGWLQFHDGDVADGAALGDTEPAVVAFHLTRLPEGTFTFEPTPHAIPVRPPIELATLVRGVEEVERAWREIEVVLPSRQVGLHLAPALGRASITLSPDQWAALVAIVDVGWLGGLAAQLGWGEFGCARTVKDLVDIGAVVVDSERPTDGDLPLSHPGARHDHSARAPAALQDDSGRLAEDAKDGGRPGVEPGRVEPVRVGSPVDSAERTGGEESDGALSLLHPAESERAAGRLDGSPRDVPTVLVTSPVSHAVVDTGQLTDRTPAPPHDLAEVAPPMILVVPPLPPDPDLDRETPLDLAEVTLLVTDRGERGDPDETIDATASPPSLVAGREPPSSTDGFPDAERDIPIEADPRDTGDDDASGAAPIARRDGADVDRSALLRELRSL